MDNYYTKLDTILAELSEEIGALYRSGNLEYDSARYVERSLNEFTETLDASKTGSDDDDE